MALINENFLKLQNNYLFSDIAKRVNSFKVTHPKAKIIRMLLPEHMIMRLSKNGFTSSSVVSSSSNSNAAAYPMGPKSVQ